MNHLRSIKAALLVVVAVMFVGCKSKQETPGVKSPALPQNAGEIKSISGQNVVGGVATSPQDKLDAEKAAARVLAQMESGDFAAIYNAAAPDFRQIGSEANFVALFQQKRKMTGPLKSLHQVSFVTLPGNNHVLIFTMENERFRTERRLTLVRGKFGKMELHGLNQHDEPRR